MRCSSVRIHWRCSTSNPIRSISGSGCLRLLKGPGLFDQPRKASFIYALPSRLFVPSGFLLTGLALLLGDVSLVTAGTHAWTAGAIGIMTLAVMTRATRGHSGQALHAPWSTTWLIYALAVTSAATSRDNNVAFHSWSRLDHGLHQFHGPLQTGWTVEAANVMSAGGYLVVTRAN